MEGFNPISVCLHSDLKFCNFNSSDAHLNIQILLVGFRPRQRTTKYSPPSMPNEEPISLGPTPAERGSAGNELLAHIILGI